MSLSVTLRTIQSVRLVLVVQTNSKVQTYYNVVCARSGDSTPGFLRSQ